MTTLLHTLGADIGPLNADLVLHLLLAVLLCGLVGLERNTATRVLNPAASRSLQWMWLTLRGTCWCAPCW